MHVAIIGNGIAGVSAALRVRALQPGWRISLISGESQFHYSRPALMYIYMGHMRYADTKPYEDSFWREQRLDLVRDWVVGVDTVRRELRLHRGQPLAYDRLLIATGSQSNRFGWKGQDLAGVQGLYDLMDLDLLYRNTENCKHAVIVGGGLVGIELAEMLLTQGIRVTFLVREASYWDNVLPAEESALVNRVVRRHGIELKLSTQLKEIVDGGNGRAAAVITDHGERIDCQLVGLTAGVTPNIDLARDTPIAVGRGILVDSSLRTSVDGVFAAGDCAEIRSAGARNLIQQVWYTGRVQGEVAGDGLAGVARTYDPGIWYNSAKFFDLEYQTYGQVNLRVPGEHSLYWEHANHEHAARIVHVDGRVIGFNFMGLRRGHRVCEQWIRDGRDADYVLAHLADANFDPEFHARFEPDMVRTMRAQLEARAQGVTR